MTPPHPHLIHEWSPGRAKPASTEVPAVPDDKPPLPWVVYHRSEGHSRRGLAHVWTRPCKRPLGPIMASGPTHTAPSCPSSAQRWPRVHMHRNRPVGGSAPPRAPANFTSISTYSARLCSSFLYPSSIWGKQRDSLGKGTKLHFDLFLWLASL